jgi:hypothetical protein
MTGKDAVVGARRSVIMAATDIAVFLREILRNMAVACQNESEGIPACLQWQNNCVRCQMRGANKNACVVVRASPRAQRHESTHIGLL